MSTGVGGRCWGPGGRWGGGGAGGGGGGGLACSTPSAIGPDRRGHRGVACTRSEPRALGAKCSVTLALERVTMGNPRFLCTRSPNGRGLAPIGTFQHQICLVRPFLSRKAIFFWVLWAPYRAGRIPPPNNSSSIGPSLELAATISPEVPCPKRPPAKSACLEGPILEAHIGTLHSPAVSHLLSDTTFPQLGILRVPLFVPVLAGFLLRTNQVRSAPVSNWQPLSHRRYHVRRRNTEELYRSLETHTIATSSQPPSRIRVDDNVRGRTNQT